MSPESLSPAQVAGLAELHPEAAVSRSPATVAQQGVVRVTGVNFGPLERVRIQIRDRRVTVRALGTLSASRAGRVTRSVAIPAAMAVVTARITATGLTSRLAPTVSIRIT